MALPVACGWASPSLPSPHQKCFVMRWAGRTRPVQRCFRRSGLGAAPSYQYGPFGRCRIEFHHPVRGFGGVTVLLPLRMAPDTWKPELRPDGHCQGISVSVLGANPENWDTNNIVHIPCCGPNPGFVLDPLHDQNSSRSPKGCFHVKIIVPKAHRAPPAAPPSPYTFTRRDLRSHLKQVCIISTNKPMVSLYSEWVLRLSWISLNETSEMITLFRLLPSWLNTID